MSMIVRYNTWGRTAPEECVSHSDDDVVCNPHRKLGMSLIIFLIVEDRLIIESLISYSSEIEISQV